MPTFLHVGCGEQRKEHTTPGFNSPGWQEIRLDINRDAKPDIIGTMTDMTAVDDASMDALYSSHNIEHLNPFEVPAALAEFLRVLKPDGFAVITCPDLRAIAALVVEDRLTEPAYVSAVGPIAPLDMLFGHQAAMARGNMYMAHRTGFTRRTLLAALQEAGFGSVATMERPQVFDLWALATRTKTTRDRMQTLAEAHFPLTRATGAADGGAAA